MNGYIISLNEAYIMKPFMKGYKNGNINNDLNEGYIDSLALRLYL